MLTLRLVCLVPEVEIETVLLIPVAVPYLKSVKSRVAAMAMFGVGLKSTFRYKSKDDFSILYPQTTTFTPIIGRW